MRIRIQIRNPEKKTPRGKGILITRRQDKRASFGTLVVRVVDPDPHEFELLDPDPGGKNDLQI
jgi:hypothetical protein